LRSCSAEGNDTWQRYQSTRVKLHRIELGVDLVRSLALARRAEAK
jgi:hypothetical protein